MVLFYSEVYIHYAVFAATCVFMDGSISAYLNV